MENNNSLPTKSGNQSRLRRPLPIKSIIVVVVLMVSAVLYPSLRKPDNRHPWEHKEAEESEVWLTVKTNINTGYNTYLVGEDVKPTGLPTEHLVNTMPDYLKEHIQYFYLKDNEDEYAWAAGLDKQAYGMMVVEPEFGDYYYIVHHELGHLIDYRFSPVDGDIVEENLLSGQQEWMDVWKEEWKDTDLYGSTSPADGFAQAFSAYLTGVLDYSRYELEESMPLSHAYMDTLNTTIEEHWNNTNNGE